MVQKDIAALSSANYVPTRERGITSSSSSLALWGYFCVPTVAGWIIEAGGGIGAYGRNVNSVAKSGAQGAYTGGKASAAGMGAIVGNIGGRIKGDAY